MYDGFQLESVFMLIVRRLLFVTLWSYLAEHCMVSLYLTCFYIRIIRSRDFDRISKTFQLLCKKFGSDDQTTYLTSQNYVNISHCCTDIITMGTDLCCCEYNNNQSHKSHLLACCCDCQELDEVCTRCVACQKIDIVEIKNMLLTFQDRLRIPWRGGAKQVACTSLIPALAIPAIILVAAINIYVTIVIFLSSITFIGYTLYYTSIRRLRTRFFCVWIFWSVIYMAIIFELTVPLLELLPEENLLLVVLVLGSIFCLWRTRKRAELNNVVHVSQFVSVSNSSGPTTPQGSDSNDTPLDCPTTLLMEPETVGLNTSQTACKNCHKSGVTGHCNVCSCCVLKRRHHSYWLDCCIGEWNFRYYMTGLVFAELALLFGSELTLTAICHPLLLVRLFGVPIMVPDECADVYEFYQFSIAFVTSVYALVMALSVLVAIINQIYLIIRGAPSSENERSLLKQKSPFWHSLS